MREMTPAEVVTSGYLCLVRHQMSGMSGCAQCRADVVWLVDGGDKKDIYAETWEKARNVVEGMRGFYGDWITKDKTIIALMKAEKNDNTKVTQPPKNIVISNETRETLKRMHKGRRD